MNKVRNSCKLEILSDLECIAYRYKPEVTLYSQCVALPRLFARLPHLVYNKRYLKNIASDRTSKNAL